jgi:hypothetical protein
MNTVELMEYLFTPMAQIALIIGIAEIIKRIGFNRKYIPLIDLGLGLISGICVFGLVLGYDIAHGAVIGVALGLSACGLFSGIKNVSQGDAQLTDEDIDDKIL